LDTIIVLVIAGVTALFIALPFFLNKDGDARQDRVGLDNLPPDPAIERINALQNQKESLYSAIRDIDFDYGLGKLTKEDYEELRLKYRIEAASVLQKIDDMSKGRAPGSLERQIEDEIKASRALKSVSPQLHEEDEIEKEILKARKNLPSSGASSREGLNCPVCGIEYKEEDLFCSKCGEKLNGEKEDKKATTL